MHCSLMSGLGNRFLDDLRGANVLIHVVDVSGTTNEKGENTSDYNPERDAAWLEEEIELWVFGNIMKRWKSITRRHVATYSTALTTLRQQLGGYGCAGCN